MGDGLPEILADGAAIGNFTSSKRAFATGFEGILMATVSNPPLVLIGTISFLFNMIVIGPGQNLSIIISAFSFIFSAN